LIESWNRIDFSFVLFFSSNWCSHFLNSQVTGRKTIWPEPEMSLDFSPEDVRQHLENLGYTNTSEDQLKDFVRDLRRLIRYEEKQKKLQNLIIQERQRTNINQDDGDDENEENDESSRDELDKSANIKIKHSKREAVYRDFQKETKVKKVLTKQRNTVKYNKNTGDISVTNDSVSLSYEESNSSREQELEVVEEVLRIGVETRRPAFMDVTLGADQRQILPPRPELPTKPTCSFIRPVIKEVKPKNLKQDPVKLHQFYKEHWEKTRLPGELNKTEKDLRWATREWMSKPQ